MGADALKNRLTATWGKADLIMLGGDSIKAAASLMGRCAIYFDVTPKGYAGHAGLIKGGRYFRQSYEGMPTGLIYVWFVPCECKGELRLICKPCKRSSEKEDSFSSNTDSTE